MKNNMEYEKVNLFGSNKSTGTFDDFFDTEKYDCIEDAWAAEDYVKCDFVRDNNEVLYIEASNISKPDIKKYHKLMIQHPFAGLDVFDDRSGAIMANSLL